MKEREKLNGSQLLKKFRVFYGALGFNAAFTRVTQAISNKSTPPHPTTKRYTETSTNTTSTQRSLHCIGNGGCDWTREARSKRKGASFKKRQHQWTEYMHTAEYQ